MVKKRVDITFGGDDQISQVADEVKGSIKKIEDQTKTAGGAFSDAFNKFKASMATVEGVSKGLTAAAKAMKGDWSEAMDQLQSLPAGIGPAIGAIRALAEELGAVTYELKSIQGLSHDLGNQRVGVIWQSEATRLGRSDNLDDQLKAAELQARLRRSAVSDQNISTLNKIGADARAQGIAYKGAGWRSDSDNAAQKLAFDSFAIAAEKANELRVAQEEAIAQELAETRKQLILKNHQEAMKVLAQVAKEQQAAEVARYKGLEQQAKAERQRQQNELDGLQEWEEATKQQQDDLLRQNRERDQEQAEGLREWEEGTKALAKQLSVTGALGSSSSILSGNVIGVGDLVVGGQDHQAETARNTAELVKKAADQAAATKLLAEALRNGYAIPMSLPG